MKMIPLILQNQTAQKKQVYLIKDVSFLGLRVLHDKQDVGAGVVGLLFLLSTVQGEKNAGTTEEDYYVQQMYMLESDEERQAFARSPYNVANFDGELEETYKSLIAGVDQKTGIWGTNFNFSIDQREFTYFYKFDARTFDKDTNSDTITTLICTKRVWVLIQQLSYWVLMGYPINTSIFTDERYEHIKVCNVTGLIFDASTTMDMPDGTKVNLAHFEVYFKDGLQSRIYHMNVMTEHIEGKLLTNPLSNDEYERKYKDTDTLSPMRSFIVSSPDKGFAMLGMEPIMQGFILLLVDEETSKRVNWLDWNHYIYINKEDK